MPSSFETTLQIPAFIQTLANHIRQDEATQRVDAPSRDSSPSEGVRSTIDDIIRATERALDSINEHGIQMVANLRRHRNGHSPIHRLPSETLSQIFEIVTNNTLGNFRYPRDLVRVSHRWRRVALDTPRLWRRPLIRKRGGLVLAEAFVRNSKNTPLEVVFNAKYGNDHPPIDFPAYMSLVAPHVHRWVTCDLGCFPAEELAPYLSSPAPLLESLLINRSAWSRHFPSGVDSSTALESLFGGQTPRLRTLSISSVFIPWTSPIYSGLMSLRISYIRFLKGDAIQQLLRILQGMPDLEELHLRKLDFRAAIFESTDPVVPLLRLAALCVTDLHSHVLFHVLSHVVIPPTSALLLPSGLLNADNLESVIPLQHENQTNLHNLTTVRHLLVHYTCESVLGLVGSRVSTSYGDAFDISLQDDNGDGSLEDVFQNLGRTFPMPLLESFHFERGEFVEGRDVSRLTANISEFLIRYPSIKEISFNNCPWSMLELLIPTSSRHLCPRLEKLEISDSEDLDDSWLMKIVESRLNIDASSPDVNVAVPLQHLKIDSCPKVTMPTLLELENLFNEEILVRR